MYKQKRVFLNVFLLILVATVTSCVNDLNTSPIDDDVVTSESLYDTPQDYKQVLAKLYAGFAATGQQGPAGDPDIQGIDEGFSSYLRQQWVHQEIPTDEAVNSWDDPGLPEFNYQGWTPSNNFVMGLYSRIFYEITLTNEFIRNAKGNSNSKVQEYNAEARFIRALSYWHALDFYGGSAPFVTEKDGVGAYQPKPVGSDSLFNYIESELLTIENDLPAPGGNEYGRVDQGAVWTLLSKLYLNANTYIGENHYTEAVNYTDKVIESNEYSLESNYGDLFRSDNHTANGIIFPIVFDSGNLISLGGPNFIVHAQVGGSMDATNYGIEGGWAGNRVTAQFVNKFDKSNDSRAMFYTDGQSKKINNLSEFTNGYAITKWKNITSEGNPAPDPEYADIDFPMFRLADVYLMYAEAIVRGGQGGNKNKAVNLVNDIRERAYGDASGDITASELTLEFILNERSRELYWEGHRRTDLIRYNYFTGGDYVWAWKGNTKEGSSTNQKYKLYPIPASDVNSNPNLSNPDY